MMHPTLDVLTGGDLPVRGADGGTEEADGFPEQLLVDARIPIGGPLTGQVQQVDEHLRAEELRRVDPLVVEPIEGGAEVDAIPQKPKEAGRCAVPLAGQQGQVVSEHVRSHTLNVVRRTFGGTVPVGAPERPQQLDERGSLRSKDVDDIQRSGCSQAHRCLLRIGVVHSPDQT